MLSNLFTIAQTTTETAAPAAAPSVAASPAPVESVTDVAANVVSDTVSCGQSCINWLQTNMWNIIGFFISLLVLKLVLGIVTKISKGYRTKAESNGNHLDFLVIDLITGVVKGIIWAVAILFIAENTFGINVSTILAGAGIFSLAIAFAAQNTIANMFGAVSLILDKPFTIGNRIIANGIDGIVEHVGLRSTRIRTLDGDLVTIPNKDLSECSIQNLTAKPNFKQTYSIGLVYSSTPEQMQKAIDILTDIFANSKLIDNEKALTRIGFGEMKDWSLNITVIAWFQTTDFFEMCGEKSRINFEILKRFNEAGLEFAYPSQTLYLAGDATRPVDIRQGK